MFSVFCMHVESLIFHFYLLLLEQMVRRELLQWVKRMKPTSRIFCSSEQEQMLYGFDFKNGIKIGEVLPASNASGYPSALLVGEKPPIPRSDFLKKIWLRIFDAFIRVSRM